jgi:hypothetical protein
VLLATNGTAEQKGPVVGFYSCAAVVRFGWAG